jgi:NAD(P)H-quinone oxidoreductase subunit 6
MVVIGKHFFSDFLLPFELASVLLLMAMIGAIVLARRDFLPDEELLDQNGRQTSALTLPERPRELISSGKE